SGAGRSSSGRRLTCAFSLYWRMSEARRFNYSDGPFGGVSGGECSGLPVDTMLNQGQVVGLHFDADRVEAFDECGFDGGARSGERVKHGATGWGDETEQPSHDREGLHSGVLDAVNVRAFTLRSLRRIEETRRAALVGFTRVQGPAPTVGIRPHESVTAC